MDIVLGTRGSRLAIAQSRIVEKLLKKEFPDISITVVKIMTRGDEIDREGKTPDEPGVYTSRLEEQLDERRIDIAVHSLKDLPARLDERFTFTVPQRGDPRDAILSRNGMLLSDLPRGAKVGTHSPRRTAQVLRMRPDLEVVPIRGNVDTRIAKMRKGKVDALVLAAAGIIRLGFKHKICYSLHPEKVPPSPGQGALAVEYLKDNTDVADAMNKITCSNTYSAVTAERAFFAAIGAGCRTPAGGYAVIEGDTLRLTGSVYSLDGKRGLLESCEGVRTHPEDAGRQLAEIILGKNDGILPEKSENT